MSSESNRIYCFLLYFFNLRGRIVKYRNTKLQKNNKKGKCESALESGSWYITATD